MVVWHGSFQHLTILIHFTSPSTLSCPMTWNIQPGRGPWRGLQVRLEPETFGCQWGIQDDPLGTQQTVKGSSVAIGRSTFLQSEFWCERTDLGKATCFHRQHDGFEFARDPPYGMGLLAYCGPGGSSEGQGEVTQSHPTFQPLGPLSCFRSR